MICVTGAASVIVGSSGPDPGEACDPTPFLRVRKSRKYMGTQDDLAVVAAGRAIASAGLSRSLGERAGLFLAVGYIPFREDDIAPVLAGSIVEGRFDPRRFGAEGFQRAHPLLTFRCLPNMPAYHVSACFGVEGPYCVTYPGPSQLYAALEEAVAALDDGRVDIALVGGVAHQSNFLVRSHFARIEPPVPPERLRDAGAFLVLEDEAHAAARGAASRAKLLSARVAYDPIDVLTSGRGSLEHIDGVAAGDELGPALLIDAIASAIGSGRRVLRHDLEGRDGVSASSEWEIA